MTNKRYFDYPMLFLVIFLILFGLVMIFSTSSYKGTANFGNPFYWVYRQGLGIALGTVAMVIFAVKDYRFLKNEAIVKIGYFGSLILLVAVLVIGASKKGSTRWISLGPIQFQPSELAKIFLVLFLAYFLSVNAHKIKTFKDTLKALALGAPCIILVGTQNLSTALVMTAMTAGMVFVVTPKSRELIRLALVGVAGMVGVLVLGAGYRSERLDIWLHPESHEKGLQTMQALYAIGSGGIFGKGLGQSMQKMGFIPESHNDMIFSIICEELGLFGAVCIILVFAALLWRMILIAINSEDLFGSLISIGFMIHIGVQVFINIAVVTNTIPPTGIPLPFISYGGTSIAVIMAEMGIVLSVSRRIRFR